MTKSRTLLLACALLVLSSGCEMARKIVGLPPGADPSDLKSAEARWLLIQNPRYGEVPSEPEYIWVEEDKVPTSFKTLIRGKSSVLAPAEVVGKYGPPPGGGKISPLQGVPYHPAASPRPAPGAPASAQAAPAATPNRAAVTGPSPAPLPAVEMPKRGYVVHVDTTRIAIDLTAADGLRPGSVVSIRRDKTPIMHPVPGEKLGELDEEVATAKVVELRDRFSLAEIQSVNAGAQIEVRDRVVAK